MVVNSHMSLRPRQQPQAHMTVHEFVNLKMAGQADGGSNSAFGNDMVSTTAAQMSETQMITELEKLGYLVIRNK